MTGEELIDLAIRLWPLIQKLRELHDQVGIERASLTEAEARAELSKAVSDLDQKILADQAKHPE